MRRIRLPYVLVVMFGLFASSGLSVSAADSGLPVHQGGHEVNAQVTHAGAKLVLKNGFSLVLPAGLPIGSARTVTFKVAKKRVRSEEIAPGFVPIGPTVDFNVNLAARDEPVLASYVADRFRPRAGHKLVLAMEQPGFCDPQKNQAKLGGGLCSTWSLIDAAMQGSSCVAKLRELGGYRMQFGSVPNAAPPAPSE